jgi:glycosyltransferase involved in cell wall biosynthesis
MKIAFISGSWQPAVCGIGDLVKTLARFLTVHRDIETAIITTKGYNGSGGKNPRTRVYPAVKAWKWRSLFLLMRTLGKISPDIVHIQYPAREFKKSLFINFLPLILRFLRYHVVITIHEYSFNLSWKGRVRLWPSILGAERILVSDPAYIPDIRKVFKDKKITALPSPSNIPSTRLTAAGKKALRKKLSGKAGFLLLGFFGFVNRNKIILPLLETIKILNTARHIPAKLIIIGDWDRDHESINIKNEIEKMGLSEFCVITGFVSDIEAADYLSILDFAVLLYKSGISPRNATFQAAVCQNIKIITTENPVYKPDYEKVLILKDGPELAKDLCQVILKNKDKLDKKAPVDYFEKSWTNYTDKHLEIYSELLWRS